MKRALLVVSAIVLLGCQSSGDAKSTSDAPGLAPGRVVAAGGSHVVVIVMENKEYGDVIGSPTAPYASALARRYASATRFYGVTHPSLPNYFALTAGTTFGVHSDCTDCPQSGDNIASQLEVAGLSWRAYMGGMPSPCFKGASSGQYAKKHDPFMYYPGVADDPSRCSKVVPEAQLAGDLSAGQLPTFAFLAPGLCDDTHDCPVNSGDQYLARVVPAILRALGPNGFLVVTWDEGTSNKGCCGGLAQGGQIPTVIAGPGVRRGAQLASSYSHYSTLRTIEDALGLPALRNAGSSQVKPLTAAFKSGVPKLR